MVPRPRSKDMLVLLDGTQLSEQVLPHAKNYAETFGMGLTLLRVFDPPYILSDTRTFMSTKEKAPGAEQGGRDKRPEKAARADKALAAGEMRHIVCDLGF